MKDKLQEVAATYRKMIENKNEGGRRISRLRYVKQEQKHLVTFTINTKGKCLLMKLKLGQYNA